jgi:hypothetical protein
MPLATVVDAEEAHLDPDVVPQGTLVLLAMPLHEKTHYTSSEKSRSKTSRIDDELKNSKPLARQHLLRLQMDCWANPDDLMQNLHE